MTGTIHHYINPPPTWCCAVVSQKHCAKLRPWQDGMGPVTMVKAKCSQTLSWTGHRPTCTFFPYDADVIGGGGGVALFWNILWVKNVFFFLFWQFYERCEVRHCGQGRFHGVSMDKLQIPTLYHTVQCETSTYVCRCYRF